MFLCWLWQPDYNQFTPWLILCWPLVTSRDPIDPHTVRKQQQPHQPTTSAGVHINTGSMIVIKYTFKHCKHIHTNTYSPSRWLLALRTLDQRTNRKCSLSYCMCYRSIRTRMPCALQPARRMSLPNKWTLAHCRSKINCHRKHIHPDRHKHRSSQACSLDMYRGYINDTLLTSHHLFTSHAWHFPFRHSNGAADIRRILHTFQQWSAAIASVAWLNNKSNMLLYVFVCVYERNKSRCSHLYWFYSSWGWWW